MVTDPVLLSPRDRTILQSILMRFADRIERVDIFGSRALGRATPTSDIDLVIHGDIDDATIARLWTLFSESSLAVTVDILAYRSLGDVPLRRHIDRYARQLFSGDDLRHQA